MEIVTVAFIGAKVFIKGVIFAFGVVTGKWIFDNVCNEENYIITE